MYRHLPISLFIRCNSSSTEARRVLRPEGGGALPGDAVYGEKRITVEEGADETKTKVEYRVWNPFRSKIAAAILGGVDNIWMAPGSRVLYLGAASGTSVSHVSDLVGETGVVYAVEFSHRSGRDLINVAKKRTNIIPIIEDARHPSKYRMLVGMVDTIFADVAQPDQARIVALNAADALSIYHEQSQESAMLSTQALPKLSRAQSLSAPRSQGAAALRGHPVRLFLLTEHI